MNSHTQFGRSTDRVLTNRPSKAWSITIQLHSPDSNDNLFTDAEAALLNAVLTTSTCASLLNDPNFPVLQTFDSFFSKLLSCNPVNPPVENVVDLTTPPRLTRTTAIPPLQNDRLSRSPSLLISSPETEFCYDSDLEIPGPEAQRWEDSDDEMTDPVACQIPVYFPVLEANDRWRVLNGATSPAALCGRIERGTNGNLHIQAILLATGPPSRNGNGISRITAKYCIENIFQDIEVPYLQRCVGKRYLGQIERVESRNGRRVIDCALDLLEYCTTKNSKSGQWCIGSFQYGVIPPTFRENLLRRNKPEEPTNTRSTVAAELNERVRSGEWENVEDMMCSLTPTELAKVGRFLSQGGLYDRLFEVQRRNKLYAVAGKERIIVWIHGPAGIGKDRLAVWSIARKWLKKNWTGYTNDKWLSQIAFKTNDKWWGSGDSDKLVAVWSDARLEFTDGNGNIQKGIPYVEILTLFDRISARPVEIKGRMASLNTRLIIVTAPERATDFVRPLDGVTQDGQNAKEQLLRRINIEMTIENSKDPISGEMKPMNEWKTVITSYNAPTARDDEDRSNTCLQMATQEERAKLQSIIDYC